MSLFVGVDGGGTRTRAVVLDADGREVTRAEDEGAVATAERPDDAAQAVRRVVERAVAAAGHAGPVDVLWAGLAGAGTAVPRAAVTRALQGLGLARRLTVGTDVEAAFYDAFGDGPGLLVIAGTGSIVWARYADGSEKRVGGWGRTLGDEGSGYWIGLEGLRRLTWSADGRADPTTMEDPLLDACGVGAADEAVAWIEKATKSQVASLAPRVVACAEEGDAAATAVVNEAVEHLAAMVRTAAGAEDHGGAGEVVLWGGLVAPGGPLRTRLASALERSGLRVSDKDVDPPLGAARLARVGHG